MVSTESLSPSAFADPTTGLARMIVTRRCASDRRYEAIGYLSRATGRDGSTVYEFGYLRSAAERGIDPVIGFSDLTKTYRSPRLFPSFAERVISAKRPDRGVYLRGLSLDETADSWEILGASGGHREGDPIELIPLPTYQRGGQTTAHFLAHAVRHLEGASDAIEQLAPHEALGLRPEPTNPKDPTAIQVTSGNQAVGYVPAPLTEYVHSVIDSGVPFLLSVVQANPAQTHPHLRLLLRLEGGCSRFVFDEPHWRMA
ncbi:HIRAN domain-containing protein [Williamsia sp. CHRR-6]|uniref:HIRAN domain-containing protein n=1 Tax=Williamsia sp. CHRR-6 TaxID=2835871 RepID=UPI001BDAAAC5|nr:HIRAN domain-containing protein [Williamsia sp. CHRR-6]MBT0568492.1 hypothetical protein [Williamsia sp. CHRR-6]